MATKTNKKSVSRDKKITVRLSASTARWLNALARSQTDFDGKPVKVSVAELLEQAAFCMADSAGKRDGSWEADVARRMLESSGFKSEIPSSDYRTLDRLREWDRADNQKHFAWWNAMTPEDKADYWGMTGDKRASFIAGCANKVSA